MTRRLPEEDPILVEIVEAELEPYRTLLSPELFAFFRREGLLLLAMHPTMTSLLEQLREPPAVGKSGVLGVDGEEDDTEPRASGGGRGGGR
jgi:hypothetical protein